jgi:hypothetical protein
MRIRDCCDRTRGEVDKERVFILGYSIFTALNIRVLAIEPKIYGASFFLILF